MHVAAGAWCRRCLPHSRGHGRRGGGRAPASCTGSSSRTARAPLTGRRQSHRAAPRDLLRPAGRDSVARSATGSRVSEQPTLRPAESQNTPPFTPGARSPPPHGLGAALLWTLSRAHTPILLWLLLIGRASGEHAPRHGRAD